MVVFFNLVLFALAATLGVQLVLRYRQRPRAHTLWYGVGLLLTAVAVVPSLVLELTSGLPAPLWWLYWVAASATVGFLGTGTAFLISERFGKDVLVVIAALTIALFLAAVLTSPRVPEVIDLTSSPSQQIRVFFLLQNIGGSMLIIGGAAYSYYRTRLNYNLLIIVGTLIFASGGRLGGSTLFVVKAIGMLVLYFGVTQSLTAFRPKQAAQASSADAPVPVPVEPLTLRELQGYIGRQPAQGDAHFLKLVGEVGQLANALRPGGQLAAGTETGRSVTEERLYNLLYSVVALANVHNVDLEASFRSREQAGQEKAQKSL